jgi:2-keto-myo-inositol isomerase
MARLCINPATTMPTDFATDVRAYSAAGWRAMELWLAKVDQFVEAGHSLKDAAALMRDNGLRAPSGCALGGLMLSEGDDRRKAQEDLRRRCDMAAALDCPVLIVCSEGLPHQVPKPAVSLYDRAAAGYGEACDIAAGYGISLALEFIKGACLAGTPLTAQRIASQAKRENAGVLLDAFHFYAGFSKLEDLDQIDGGRLLFVHWNDAPASIPREVLTDKDRVWPGEGGFPLAEMHRRLQARGYAGYYSVELFSDVVWAQDPFVVARRAREIMIGQLGSDEA